MNAFFGAFGVKTQMNENENGVIIKPDEGQERDGERRM